MDLFNLWNFLLITVSQPLFNKQLFYYLILIALMLIWMIILRYAALMLVHKPSAHLNNKFLFSYFPILDCILITYFIYSWVTIPLFFPSYFIFFSALTITIHTDLQSMLISRFVSLYMIPLGILLSYAHCTLISPLESFISAILGYIFLLLINQIFYWFKKYNGLGQGDIELLAFIGSFIGLIGCWITILCGSTLGTLAGSIYMLWTKKHISTLPFGLFLAIGALSFVALEKQISMYLIANVI